MRPLRAVIFDLDGTLTTRGLDFDAIRREVGVREGPILEAMEAMSADERARVAAVLERHETRAAEACEPSDGAHEVIAALRRQGHALAVMTRNSRRSAETVLRRFGLAFEIVRTREDGANKPSAESVHAICEALGVKPAETVVVGDYLYDVQAGRAAGAVAVLFAPGAQLPPYAGEADRVIRHLSELTAIMDGQ